MAAPMGPASHEMMNPATVSSRSKTISHAGLSGSKLVMRRSESLTGRRLPSDPAIVTPSRLNKLRENSLELLVHNVNWIHCCYR